MKKKYWALGAGLALSLVLCTGCGEKGVVDKMYETTMDSVSFNMMFDTDVEIIAKDPEESTVFKVDMNVDGLVAGMNDNAFTSKIKGKTSYNYADADMDESSFKACYENEVGFDDDFVLLDEDGEEIEMEDVEETATADAQSASSNSIYPEIGNSILYLCDDGEDEWYYESDYDEDIEYVVTLDRLDTFKNGIKDLLYKSKKKMGSTNINGEDCYILEKKLSADDANVLVQSAVTAFFAQSDMETVNDELEELFGCPAEDFVKAAKPVLKVYVSKNNGYFMGADIDLSKIDVKKYLSTMEMNMQDFADDVGAEGIKKVKINTILLSLRLADINNVAVEIPESVKMVYLEDWFDMGDFDYEIGDWEIEEIDDEDWDDDDEDWEIDIDDEDDDDDEDWLNEDDEDDFFDDDEDDEDWDDDDDEDWEEDEDASDATSVDLFDEDGNKLCTVKVPSSVHYYPDYSEGSCLDFMDAAWTIDCYVSSTIDQGYASYELEEFLLEAGEEDYDPAVTYSKEAIAISVMGGTAYYMTGNGLDGEEHYIVIPYTTSEGDPEYVTVSFDENRVAGWNRQNYIDFANQMFN